MVNTQVVELQGLRHVYRGKVRDMYEIDGGHLLMVASDRISAFDSVVGEVPKKGQLLTSMSKFWFDCLKGIVPNHLVQGFEPEDVVVADDAHLVVGRALVVRRLKPIMFEAVVRGYLVGSAWADYQKTGSVCGIKLSGGLQLAERLPEPIFTPATKAALGEHDENVTFDYMVNGVGVSRAHEIRDLSLQLYAKARDHALARGIIIADTKFEFGLDQEGNLVLMDEVLTPDSSRYWPVDKYVVGRNPPSFDKQPLRDWIKASGWKEREPIARDVLEETQRLYQSAYRSLCF